jgi:glycosyltransferase involved in cell wall biosynthesis
MKVLFLSAWYPTERDAMAGLFVEKHVKAVATQGHDVRVLYSEAVGWQWICAMYKGWKKLQQEWGKPDIVQMNVLDKNGIIALLLRWWYGIPYVIVEHWSGYLPANYAFRGGWHGWMMKVIARHASCILPVSRMLEESMKNCGIRNEHWQRIHNVVDDFFYHPISPITVTPKGDKYRFLHVSCFDEQAKNIEGMLRAVGDVAQLRRDFELVIVGTGVDYARVYDYAQSLHLPKEALIFTGEQTPYEVAQWMQQSDCFLLFSRYETFAVVLAEAMAVGIPFISSDTAGIAVELPSNCGILVPSEDEVALANAMVKMLDNEGEIKTDEIRKQGERYTYQAVGKQLSELYQRMIVSAN